jgi:uncharacterized phage protein (TIGR02218 family)
MSFEAYEESQAGASKIELYTLTIGSTIYRMHDSVELILNPAGDNFHQAQISRGPIATGQESLEVSLPGDHEFALKFASIAPGQTATLTIQAYHRNDPATELVVIYKGVVRSVAFTQNASKSAISFAPINEALDKQIPERTFQAACNNVLFDPDCKVSAGAHSYTNTVSGITDNVVTVTGLNTAKGTGWSTGGYVSYGTLDYRLILEQDGDDLTLVLPFHTNVTGQSVTVYAGCDHSIGVCNSKFSNESNFGGCPYVPTKNIFATGIK